MQEVVMPNVKGKKYPYTKEGIAAADKARRGYKQGKRVTKAKGGKAGKQFVKQPKGIAKKTARYR